MTHNIVYQLEEFAGFVRSLDTLEEKLWFAAIGEGKWSIHDIITHIMKWDEYFNHVTFPDLMSRKTAELKEHPDYLGFNEQSVRYGRNKTGAEIRDKTLHERHTMISNLKDLEEKDFRTVYPGERGYNLESFLDQYFVSHDRHHMKQIRHFLSTALTENADPKSGERIKR